MDYFGMVLVNGLKKCKGSLLWNQTNEVHASVKYQLPLNTRKPVLPKKKTTPTME